MPEKILLDPYGRRLANIFTPEDLARLYRLADVVWGRNEPIPPEEAAKVKGEVVAVVTTGWRHGDLADFPKLRAILEVGGAFPSPEVLDYDTCFARGIRVLSCAPAFAPVVAEMALALALAGARNVVSGDAAFRNGTELYDLAGNAEAFMLYDQQVGFVGFGNLARALKPLLTPFRCPIQVYDPWLAEGYLRTQGVTPVSLETLLETSKVTFVLATPTQSNRGLLSRQLLERIPKGSLLVLISRAHLVDFDALTEMAAAGRFKAAIDVFPVEPIPADAPIRRAPNTILSAHRAGGDANAYPFIGKMVVNDLEALLAGLPPQQMQVAQPEIIRLRGVAQQSTSAPPAR